LNGGTSSNLLSDGNSVDLVFPSSGAEAKIEFTLDTGATTINFPIPYTEMIIHQ
jgi:hypothetical protein